MAAGGGASPGAVPDRPAPAGDRAAPAHKAAAGAGASSAGGAAAPARPRPWLLHPAVKPAVFVLCLLPFAWLFWRAFADQLGANPAEAVIRDTGDWALRLLCLTLAVTPLRVWLGQPALLRLRRMLGLYVFFYAVLHFLAYAWLDMGLDLQAIAKDIPKRPFALVGFLALLLLVPLAATSFDRAIRALGGRRWQKLHRLVYAVALLALLHFFWMKAGKNDFAEWSVYAAVLGVLLGWRALRAWRGRGAAVRPPATGVTMPATDVARQRPADTARS